MAESLDDLVIGATLGQGAQSIVYKVRHNQLAGEYALKVTLKKELQNPAKFRQVEQEVSVLSSLSHPHIVKFLSCFEDED